MTTEKNIVYFDNASTTKPCESAVLSAEAAMRENYGNPSSLHGMGLEAENIVKNTLKQITKLFPSTTGCSTNRSTGWWIFTSGGTESNNTAIFSGILSKTRGRRIITTKAEHPSVLTCFDELSKNGYETVYLPLGENGQIDPDDLKRAVTPETAIVSIAHVNNETGVINPVAELSRIIKEKSPYTLIHCDAVQSFGKLDITGLTGSVDYLTISAHKIHGIKGCGALYAAENAPLKPLIHGGGQQKNRRSGTENTVGIAAFGSACSETASKMHQNYKTALEIKEYIINNCITENIVVNGSVEESSPFILNMSVPGVRSEVMLHSLEAEGIYVSAGSACSSRQKSSSVLSAYGLPKDITESSIRLSFCGSSTISEAERFVTIFKKMLPKLKKYGGLKR